MRSRIKELREKRGIIQAILAAELGITQQMLPMTANGHPKPFLTCWTMR